MVLMEGSTSPASRSPSPAHSESSVDARTVHVAPQQPPTLTCQWTGCTRSFANIKGLVEHLDSEHINGHRGSYTCEWASCARQGLVQASRFALVSHCRSHTGERPFTCLASDCDKSFTRSDTLAKHMRQKHNISPPAPGRGGGRKRKRSLTPPYAHASGSDPAAPQQPPPDDPAPSHYNFANRTYAHHPDGRESGFNTFRVNPNPQPQPHPQSHPLPHPHPHPPQPEDDNDDCGYNPERAGGRSKAMVQYLIMKAKYRYVMAEQGLLSDELEALKRQEREEFREKEAGVDRVLRTYGPESEQFMHEQPNGRHRTMDADPR